MTIQGYVRDVLPGERWRDTPTPAGYRLVVVDELKLPSSGWVGWAVPDNAPGCRFGAGPGRPACGRRSVVALWRGSTRRSMWGYCELHLYGRRWENGRLLTAILVKSDEVA
jgi:hypothetical protein